MSGKLHNLASRPILTAMRSLVIATVIVGFSAQVLGQAAENSGGAGSTSTDLAAQLSQSLKSYARGILERHLRPDEFQIFVDVTPKKDMPEAMPYLPETLAPIPTSSAPVESLGPWIEKVDIEVLISDRYKQDAKSKLEAILRKSLALDQKRGDKIKFSPIGLKVDPPLSDIQRELSRAEAESRELKSRLDTLGRERDDAKRDLSQTKAELDRLAREKGAARKEDAGSEKGDGTAAGTAEKRGWWLENLGVLVAAVLALITLFVGNLTIRSAAKTLGSAVQTIGAGIPALGDKISESMAQQSPLLLPAADGSGRGSTAGDRSQVDGSGNTATMPIEAVARRVLELHDELMLAVNVDNEGTVLEHLSWLLDDETTVGHAVATMELLGKDQANSLHKKLSADHQQRVVRFLRVGVHSRPKGEVMIEVGEALKTRLFGAELPNRAKFDQAIRNKVLQLGSDDLLQVARALDGDHLARYFAYIGPAKVAPLMTDMYKADQSKFTRAASAIGRIPLVESSSELDHEIVATIEAQLTKANADVYSPYLSYYRSLLESVEDDVAALISEQISQTDVRVEKYLRDTVITFATFFKLHGDIQEEIVTGMNNRDLAALLSSLKDDLKESILEHIEAQRKELIDEEIQRLIAKGLRQVNAAHRQAKTQIVSRITKLKGSGPLSDLMADAKEQKSNDEAFMNPVKDQRAA